MSDGIVKHPEVYGSKVYPEMRLPGDTRKLRDIKIKEVPSWFMKRDWSPMGMLFGYKRFKNKVFTKYIRVKNGGAHLFLITAVWLGIVSYAASYKDIKHEKMRKYH